jgi:acetoin utilization deacetylase AcuC-like enzyme
MRVTEQGFAAMATAARRLAESTCEGKLVLVLEGGYSLPGLSRSVHACMEVLQGRSEEFPRGAQPPALEAVAQVKEALRPYWNCL